MLWARPLRTKKFRVCKSNEFECRCWKLDQRYFDRKWQSQNAPKRLGCDLQNNQWHNSHADSTGPKSISGVECPSHVVGIRAWLQDTQCEKPDSCQMSSDLLKYRQSSSLYKDGQLKETIVSIFLYFSKKSPLAGKYCALGCQNHWWQDRAPQTLNFACSVCYVFASFYWSPMGCTQSKKLTQVRNGFYTTVMLVMAYGQSSDTDSPRSSWPFLSF